MSKGFLIVSGIIVISVVTAVFVGQAYERTKLETLVETLIQSALMPVSGTVDFDSFSELPPPVARYFRHVLTDGQGLARTVKIRQSGALRISATNINWYSFTACQHIVPPATGFIWNAKVDLPFTAHVRIQDSYRAGIGSGRVSLFSAFAVVSETGAPELNSGALHRYLAEAVWTPTALLPQSGVTWTPIDDRTALATLTDNDTTVSLEFRFNDVDEVVSIYSPGRFGSFDGRYQQAPWEGHFRNYQLRAGMRIPLYGEVGWYIDDSLQLVWKGNLADIRYETGH